MTTYIIITFCVLILIAYIFDLTAARTKIPTVILLLLTGFIVQQITFHVGIYIPDMSELLSVLGTIGLILIVLEGSMELELDRSKKQVVIKSFLMALLPMIVLGSILALIIFMATGATFKEALTNVLPLCVISSAIAIPSAQALSKTNREFVTYETSLSDIVGVVLFNFIALNEVFGWATFGFFFLYIFLTLLISFAGIIGLSVLLHKINHHVKFIPIIMLVVLLYAITKELHLPGLIFIMLFGIFLGNLDHLHKIRWVQVFHVESLKKEFVRFRELTIETAFLIRTLFFLLFGFMIQTEELLNLNTLPWAIGITTGIYVVRYAFMQLFKVKENTILYIAPRGLITVLLFMSIAPTDAIPLINKSLIIQIIILTALVMMTGIMKAGKNKHAEAKPHEAETILLASNNSSEQ